MGLEDFLVKIESSQSAEKVRRALLAQTGMHPDPTMLSMKGFDCLRWEDPQHILEVEVMAGQIGSVTSIRFALCQSSTIDKVFIDIVERVAHELAARVTIAEDVEPDDPSRAHTTRSTLRQLSAISQRHAHFQRAGGD
jgi:hypothetical protein